MHVGRENILLEPDVPRIWSKSELPNFEISSTHTRQTASEIHISVVIHYQRAGSSFLAPVQHMSRLFVVRVGISIMLSTFLHSPRCQLTTTADATALSVVRTMNYSLLSHLGRRHSNLVRSPFSINLLPSRVDLTLLDARLYS